MVFLFAFCAKGQKISKANYLVLISSKKRTNYFLEAKEELRKTFVPFLDSACCFCYTVGWHLSFFFASYRKNQVSLS